MKSSHIIGTDEAGYGPNLGPLVITATHWEIPKPDERLDLWKVLESAVSQEGPIDGRLHVGDSKQVYQPGKGLAELERSVLSILRAGGVSPRTANDLRRHLTAWRGRDEATEFSAPWYADGDVELPVCINADAVEAGASRFHQTLSQSGVRLIAVHSDVVSESRFNQLSEAAGSKGAVLTESTLTLATGLRQSADAESTLVLCDKHGGRNRYAGVLTQVVGGGLVSVREEGRQRSVYQLDATEFRFETRAERYLPVAVASMVSKYLREVLMLAFNDYWRKHLPDLKPTKGYPHDAARFRNEIAETQARLGLPDDLLWRRR